ncbi:MAG: hypothetical protein HGA24_04045, partial [Candidatus Aminicenantes bacterium]|nr:hypothetical protein [Candidatus Aminicenantes bacterium]
ASLLEGEAQRGLGAPGGVGLGAVGARVKAATRHQVRCAHLALEPVARGVHRLSLPAPASDIEYYLEVEVDGAVVRYPATAPELNQTVIVLPVVK